MKLIKKKPSLKEFDITEEQYSKYQNYKTRIENRKRGRDEFEHRFYESVNAVITIILILFIVIAAKNIYFKVIINVFNNGKYASIFLLILTIFLLATLLFLIIRMSLKKTMIKKLKPLNIHKPFKKLYLKLQFQISEELYFDNAKKYELQNEKYYNYVGDIQKRFPDIIEYDNNLQVYCKKIIDEIISHEHVTINNLITNQELEKRRAVWLKMDGITFDHEVSIIYNELGYKTKTTKATGEGGIDIKLWKDEEYLIVQCKNILHETDKSAVRKLLETMQKEKASKAILISSGGFNSKAYDFAKRKPVELLNLNQFLKLANEAYPQKSKTIDEISEIHISHFNAIYYFKAIGKTNILYSCSSESEEINYSLFETREEAKKTIKTLRHIENMPLGNSLIYDVEEWWLESTPSDYNSKPVYYIKIREKEKKVKVATIKKDSWYKKHIQKEIWPTEVYVQKEIWGTGEKDK